MVHAEKLGMNSSEFIHNAVSEKMNLDKISDSHSQFFNLFDMAFKKSFENYFKQLLVILNRTEFNTRWLLKQQDIFMQQLKVPQTMEGLSFSIIEHPITEKAKDLVLKDIRKMASKKKELKDEQE